MISTENKNMTPKKDSLKKTLDLKSMRDRDRENVRGKFIFHEVPGGMMTFNFKAYKEDPVENYSLVDGQVYTLPLGVARHLNKNLWYPEYSYVKGDNGTQDVTQKVSRKIRRCSFQSLEFMDSDDLVPTSNLVTVENV